jgi:hypothetical protein
MTLVVDLPYARLAVAVSTTLVAKQTDAIPTYILVYIIELS